MDKENLMKEYEARLNSYFKNFCSESDETINKLCKKICLELEDELHLLGGVKVIDNDKDMLKKITSKFDTVVNRYAKIIRTNVEEQNKCLNELYRGMPIENMSGVEYEEVKKEDIEEITMKITDSLITHINYENTINSMYYQKIRQVEEKVKNEITKDKIENIVVEIRKIYDSVMTDMIAHCNDFRKSISLMNYEEAKAKQEMSPNAKAFMTDSNENYNQFLEQENTEYESEIARTFK